MGYNKKILSEATKKLDKPQKIKNKNTAEVQNTFPFESSEGFLNGPPPPGTNYRIPGNSIYNPTPYNILARGSNGQEKVIAAGDTSVQNFGDADYVDEFQIAKKGGEKKFSRSLSATNKLFKKNPLLKKPKSKKKKTFDPNAKRYQEGGYVDLDLDDNEILELQKGGYIVEYLDDPSIPELTRAQDGGEPVKLSKAEQQRLLDEATLSHLATFGPYKDRKGNPLNLEKMKTADNVSGVRLNPSTNELILPNGMIVPQGKYERVVQEGMHPYYTFQSEIDQQPMYVVDNPDFDKQYGKYYTQGNRMFPVYNQSLYSKRLQEFQQQDAQELDEQRFGGLTKAQRGGQRPILYVDPNDPAGRARYQAYQDSLGLYNYSNKLIREGLGYKSFSFPENPKLYEDYKIPYNPTGTGLNSNNEVYKIGIAPGEDGHAGINYRDIVEKSLKTKNKPLGWTYSDAAIPVYKKPEQPVEFKPNPEIGKLPTKKLPQVETPDIIPSNYNYTPQEPETIRTASRSQTVMEPDPNRPGKFRMKELRQVPYSAYFPGEGWEDMGTPRVMYYNPKTDQETEERFQNGGLTKAQKGGQRPILYVDPNDPAGRAKYQASADSMFLYNKGLEAKNYYEKLKPIFDKMNLSGNYSTKDFSELAKKYELKENHHKVVERQLRRTKEEYMPDDGPRTLYKTKDGVYGHGYNDWSMFKPKQLVEYKMDPEIVAKQQQLIDAGFNIGKADGIWGDKSKAAWEEFQQKQRPESIPVTETVIENAQPQVVNNSVEVSNTPNEPTGTRSQTIMEPDPNNPGKFRVKDVRIVKYSKSLDPPRVVYYNPETDQEGVERFQDGGLTQAQRGKQQKTTYFPGAWANQAPDLIEPGQEAFPFVTSESVDPLISEARLTTQQSRGELSDMLQNMYLQNQALDQQRTSNIYQQRPEYFKKLNKSEKVNPIDQISLFDYNKMLKQNPSLEKELKAQGYLINKNKDRGFVELFPANEVQQDIIDFTINQGYSLDEALKNLEKRGYGSQESIKKQLGTEYIKQVDDAVKQHYAFSPDYVAPYRKSNYMVSTDYGKVDTSVDLKNKWSDNDIITLARDKDFIDSFDINNFDASSPNARNDERWNSQIVDKLRSGKWGWKPKTNELVNLEKSEAYKPLATGRKSLAENLIQQSKTKTPTPFSSLGTNQFWNEQEALSNRARDYNRLGEDAWREKYSPTYEQTQQRWQEGKVPVEISEEAAYRPKRTFQDNQYYQYGFEQPTGVDPVTGETITQYVSPEDYAGRTAYMSPEESEKYNKQMLAENRESFMNSPIYFAPGMIAAGAALAPTWAGGAGGLGSLMSAAPISSLPGLTAGNALNAAFAYDTLRDDGLIEQAYDAAQRGDYGEAGTDALFSALTLAPYVKGARSLYNIGKGLSTPGTAQTLATNLPFSAKYTSPTGSALAIQNPGWTSNTKQILPGVTSRLNKTLGNTLGQFELYGTGLKSTPKSQNLLSGTSSAVGQIPGGRYNELPVGRNPFNLAKPNNSSSYISHPVLGSRGLLTPDVYKDLLVRNYDEETGTSDFTIPDITTELGDANFKPFSPGYQAQQELSNLATFGRQPLLNRADFATQEEMFIDNLFKKYRSPDIDKELSDALSGIPNKEASDRFKAMMEEAKAEGISPDAILKRSVMRLANPSQRDVFDRAHPFYLPENWNRSNNATLWNTNYGQYKPFGKELNEYGTMGGKAPASFGESGELDQYYWDQIKRNEDLLSGEYNMSPEQRSKIQSKVSDLYKKGVNQGLQQKGFDLENPMSYTGYDAMRTLSPNKNGGELPEAQLGQLINYGSKALSKLPYAKNVSGLMSSAGKYLTTQTPLKNAWQYNPLAPKLGTYNRVVGQDAVDDLIESGLVRVNDKAGVANDLGPFGIVNRTTPYPSFAKAKPQQQYIDQVVSQGKTPYVISTDRPMRASNLGRHGKGKTQFPINDEGQYISGFPANEARLYEATPNWLKGYKPVDVPGQLPGSPNAFSSADDVSKGFKSEIDWSKWNKEIPDNKALMQEYNAIEQQAKANGTWMKNPDGSTFQGTPEQFVQQNSSNFKKAFPNPVRDKDGNIQTNYHGTKSDVPFSVFKKSKPHRHWYGIGTYTTPYKERALGYTTGMNNEEQLMELYINSNNPQKRIENIFDKKYTMEDISLQPPHDYIYTGGEQVTPYNNFLKAMRGNNGMFDMTNPNIYKALFPAAVATGAAAYLANPWQREQPNTLYQDGGIKLLKSIPRQLSLFDDVINTVKPTSLPQVINASGFTMPQIQDRLQPQFQGMNPELFENTVFSPSGKLYPTPQYSMHDMYDPKPGGYTMPFGDYRNEFNSRLDVLNDIIEKGNTSGIPYESLGLTEEGFLKFKSPQGISSWGVRTQPGSFTNQDLEEVIDPIYWRSIPGLEMNDTSQGVFGQGFNIEGNIPRGTGSYRSINDYMKKLNLGRVKSGFNAQTPEGMAAWEKFIKNNEAMGYFETPDRIFGIMKQEGGAMELELSPEEIKWYESQGYTVEDIA